MDTITDPVELEARLTEAAEAGDYQAGLMLRMWRTRPGGPDYRPAPEPGSAAHTLQQIVIRSLPPVR
jgi:hypothetical protein